MAQSFAFDQSPILAQPAFDVPAVLKRVEQSLVIAIGKIRQRAEKVRVVHRVRVQELKEIPRQLRKFRVENRNAQFLPHLLPVKLIVCGLILHQFFLQKGRVHQVAQGFAELAQIPEPDFRLPAERIASAGIGMIGREMRIELIHESVGTVVERGSGNRHIVCVHHAVDKAHRLPAGDEAGCFLQDAAEKNAVAVRLRLDVGMVVMDDIIGKFRDSFRIVVVEKRFETAEADVRIAETHQHRRQFRHFPVDQFADADDGQGPRRRDAESVQGFLPQVFADRGA